MQQEIDKSELKSKNNSSDNPVPKPKGLLKRREGHVDLVSNVGKQIFISVSSEKKETGGYWCEVCQCSIKDSNSWLEHINGAQHNARLGMSMKVEKASLRDVQALLKKIEQQSKTKKRKIPEDKLSLASQAFIIWKEREMKRMEDDPIFRQRPLTLEELKKEEGLKVESSSDEKDIDDEELMDEEIEKVEDKKINEEENKEPLTMEDEMKALGVPLSFV